MGSQVQAVTTGAVIAIRAAEAAPLLVPPTMTALEPRTDADVTAIIFANAGIVLMFIGIFTYGSWVLTGVVEEKQSRVVEVVLSTVRARDLLMGKVIGIGVLAIAQLAVLVAAGIAAAQLSGRLVLPPTTVGAVVQLLHLVHARVRALCHRDGLPRVARLPGRRSLQRVPAGHHDRDRLLHRCRCSWSRTHPAACWLGS